LEAVQRSDALFDIERRINGLPGISSSTFGMRRLMSRVMVPFSSSTISNPKTKSTAPPTIPAAILSPSWRV
jgi:hypothetical protein